MTTNLSAPVQWSDVTYAYPDYPTDRVVFTDPSPATIPRSFYRVSSP